MVLGTKKKSCNRPRMADPVKVDGDSGVHRSIECSASESEAYENLTKMAGPDEGKKGVGGVRGNACRMMKL